jgi:hypothetical protein
MHSHEIETPGVYRLSSSAVRRLLLRQSAWTPDSLLYTLVLGFGIGLLGRAPFLPMLIVLAVFSILHLRAFRSLPQLKEQWRDFEVILEPDRIFAWRRGAVECTIGQSEIRKVVEQPIHGLWIHSRDRHKHIWAPSLLTGYSLLRATLSEWTPIERKGSWQLWNYLGMPTGVAIFAATLLVRSRYVFFPLLAFLGFYLLRLARISIKSWTRSNWPSGAMKDPIWIPAIPFMMLALLAVKLVWILYR